MTNNESDRYPSNSHMEKQEITPPKKVVEVDVVEKKKSLGKRLKYIFVSDDADDVGEYLIVEVIVPTLKSLFLDTINQGFERLMFGGTPVNRNTGTILRSSSQSVRNTNVNRYSTSSTRRKPDTLRVTNKTELSDMVLGSRGDAQMALDSMYDILERYDVVSVADYYDLIGKTSEHTDNRWGWTNLSNTRIERVRGGGYVLTLPRAEPIGRDD